jgi:hypothetical protein
MELVRHLINSNKYLRLIGGTAQLTARERKPDPNAEPH